MKPAILLLPLTLAACGAYHTGRIGATVDAPDVRFVPKQVKFNVSDDKVTGVAECTSGLWIFNSVPEHQAYGMTLQTSDGNFASNECTAGAVYDAISDSNADVLIAPEYTVARRGFLCFGHRCLFGTTKVMVSGYTGKITSISDMDSDVVKEIQKHGNNKTAEKSRVSLFK